jgi:hypothetical protein
MLKIQAKQLTFEECLAKLRSYKFDVGAPSGVAKTVSVPAGAQQVAKYGCAAVIAPAKGVAAATVVRPGIVINGEIGFVLDKGYQKFIKTADAERPATADHLGSLHKFSEELRQGLGGISLYNESMGTVSDEYMYDRVKGRTLPESERPVPAWER